jgi:hypothetical protein
MQLPDIKQLEKILKLCRKQGVTELTMSDMSFKFGDLPRDQTADEPEANALGLTDEQLAFYSVDPLLQENEQ